LSTVHRRLVWKYINIEKAVRSACSRPSWDSSIPGNTRSRRLFCRLGLESAKNCRYLPHDLYQLSSDNSFYEAFTSALFFPHTDLTSFPTVEAAAARESKPIYAICPFEIPIKSKGEFHVYHR
jgi:hypothetical protein